MAPVDHESVGGPDLRHPDWPEALAPTAVERLWRTIPPGARQLLIRSRGRLLRSSFADVVARKTGRRILHCFGDSHTRVFNEFQKGHFLRRTWIEVTMVEGATAMGMVNPNSTTQALPLFRTTLRSIPKTRGLLFMMGEVDCGFLIWHRADRLGLAVDTQLELSFRNYTRFLSDVLSEGWGDVLVTTVPPPTIGDAQTFGDVALARKGVSASLLERTRLTHTYNELLRRWTNDRGVRLLDYERDVIDPETGMVKDRFRSPDPADHHLHQARFASLLATRLREYGYG